MKIVAFDGNSILNRGFYGVRPLNNKEGLHTNGIFGFLGIYFKIMESLKPDAVFVCFDLRAPTFRHGLYCDYKKTRKGMPEELAQQVPVLKELLDAMGISRLECETFEGDDLLGAIAEKARISGDECIIATGDKDNFQLIDDNTKVLYVSTKTSENPPVYNRDTLFGNYGYYPEDVIQLKALQGDSSDCIPGVAGIGEKGAMELISKFKTIDDIYENIDSPEIKESLRKKLIAGKEMAFLSRELATICREIPCEFELVDGVPKNQNSTVLYEILNRLEFKSYITRFGLVPPSTVATGDIALPDYGYTLAGKKELSNILEKAKAAPFVAISVTHSFSALAIAFQSFSFLIKEESLTEEFLKELFSEKIKKVMHDAKPIAYELLCRGIDPDGIVFDTAIASYLLFTTEREHSLFSLFAKFFPGKSMDESVLTRADAFSPLQGDAADETALHTLAVGIYSLYEILKEEITNNLMDKLYYEIELPLIKVLCKMQKEGFRVDSAAMSRLSKDLGQKLEKLTEEIYALAGEEFNIQSPKQLGEVLFEKLKVGKGKKTKTGFKTDIDILNSLQGEHPIIEKIIDYRKLAKIKSTYLDGLSRFISPDGRIHAVFNQLVTVTGRISMTEPNLQNIPIRGDMGGEIRKMFIPAPGCVLVDADYSQIELRVLAHISNDVTMLSLFRLGEDIHTQTASQIFGVPKELVDATMRRAAKAVNFGICYGMSEYSLAGDLGVPVFKAREYMQSYFRKYKGIYHYMTDIKRIAHEKGRVTTILGRMRDIPELKSSNYNIRSFGERVALNTPIQGTAADIMKIAMIGVSNRLARELPEAKLILQVHDELLVEVPKKLGEKAAKILTEEMENAMNLSIPLTAEANIGESWYDAK